MNIHMHYSPPIIFPAKKKKITMIPNPLTWIRPKLPYHRITLPQPCTPFHDSSDQSSSTSTLLSHEPKPEDTNDLAFPFTKPRSSKSRTTCISISISLLSLLIGFVAGQFLRLGWEEKRDGYIAPYASPHRNIPNVIWTENQTFASDPSPENDAAWIDLIPVGMGFIEHPELAPPGTPKGVSVFHQVHCLHGLRTTFFTTHHLLAHLSSLHPPPPSSPYPPTAYPPYTPSAHLDKQILSNDSTFDLAHTKHCFDYLRQALMCAADTNLEDVMFTLDGRQGNAEGWGSARVCRDYWAVKDWAERWRVTAQTGIGGN